jgi:TonB family protein
VQVLSGPPPLLVSAIDAVRQWKYKPYLVDGEPTEVDTTININFTLDGDKPQPDPDNAPSGTPQVSSSDRSRSAIFARLIETITIAASDPQYPPIAKAAHVQGDVLLRVAVSRTGEAEDVKLISGLPMLVSSAMEAARKWKFNQASFLSNEGTPIDAVLIVKFTLNDAARPQGERSPNDAPIADVLAPAQTAPQQYDGVPVRRIGGGVTQPEVIYKVDPEFSAEAKKAKFNGIVLVNLIVDAKGMPQNVHVLRGVGMGLDEQAMAAVKKYKFRPATEGGKPVPVAMNVEVNFKIF